MSQTPVASATQAAPKRAGLILTALILGAIVANINLSVANVALPDIGSDLDASQTQLNLIAIGCTLGLAMSVLYLGALGDRYGRKLMLSLGMILTVPASIVSAWAPTADLLVFGRIFTGIAAGMAYPTTLALITAIWASGPKRVKAIALWSGVSGGGAVLGPVIAGALLEQFWWGSVFLIAIIPALLTLVLVVIAVPAHVNESKNAVDHLGGVLTVFMVAALVIGLGVIASPGGITRALVLIALSLVIAAIFVAHEKRAANPLYDLQIAKRRLFWVAALGGMIAFGSLMGAMFIGQQFLQNVLDYSTLTAGLAVLPAAVGMILIAPTSAKLVISIGSRNTMLLGYACIFPAFIIMLIAWKEKTPYWQVGISYLLIGVGAALVLTPASRALTSSVPVTRVGMASGTTDLQRDLGGSIMQAILGSVLTAGYAFSMAKQIGSSPDASKVTDQTEATLQLSYSSAQKLGEQYPQYSEAITAAARESFLSGGNWAYAAAAAAIALGAVLVRFAYPGKSDESELLAKYAKADSS